MPGRRSVARTVQTPTMPSLRKLLHAESSSRRADGFDGRRMCRIFPRRTSCDSDGGEMSGSKWERLSGLHLAVPCRLRRARSSCLVMEAADG